MTGRGGRAGVPRALALRWKAAARQATADCGGLAAASAASGLSSAQLSRCQSAHEPDLLPLSAAFALTLASGSAGFAELFADLCGARLASRAESRRDGGVAALADAMSEAAELVHVAGQSLADGVVSGSEAAAIRRALGDLRDAAADLDAALPAAPLRARRPEPRGS